MDERNKEKLRRIAQYSHEDFNSEEDVKNKFVVKLLECLDYDIQDMDFESGRTDIFIKNLPQDCKVIIETKNYSSNLSNYQFISQLEDYCKRFAAAIGVLANGTEVRIYTPYLIGKKFEESMLCIIRRNDLTKDDKIKLLEKYLHKENLTSKKIKESIREREEQLDRYKVEMDALTKEIDQKILANNQMIEKLRNENEKLETQKINKIQEIKEDIGVPQITQKIESYEKQTYRTRNIYSKSSNIIEIVINSNTPRKFHLIPCPKQFRHLFPGYNLPFVLETDIGEISAKVTSAPGGTREGDPNAGTYIKSVVRNGLTLWYNKHDDLKLGDKILIEVIEPQKRYTLSIK